MSRRSDHDSMDDVLASIRRIVRAETAPDPAESKVDIPPTEAAAGGGLVSEAEAPLGGPAPEAGHGEDMSDKAVLAATPEQKPGGDAAPLLLTPEMRADPAKGHETTAGAPTGPATPAPEREILRTLIAELVAAEMRSDAIRDVLRDIVRDELINGPLGENATRNVRAMIRAEIAATDPEGH